MDRQLLLPLRLLRLQLLLWICIICCSGSNSFRTEASSFLATATAAAAASIPSPSSAPTPQLQSHYMESSFAGSTVTADSSSSSQRRRKIAVIVSTNRNGGHSTGFSFPTSTTTDSSSEQAFISDTDSISSSSSSSSVVSAVQPLPLPPRSSSSSSFFTLSRRIVRQRLWQPIQSIPTRIASAVRSTFLPAGTSSHTPPPHGYTSYALWSAVQDLATQLRSVLATHRILEGVMGGGGANNNHHVHAVTATAASALVQFVVRDGCGMLSSLLFTSAAASHFKYHVKQWRLFADCILDVGITLEVAALSVPSQFFLPMMCVGNMCKAVCGVAAGACSGAIALYWAHQCSRDDRSATTSTPTSTTSMIGTGIAVDGEDVGGSSMLRTTRGGSGSGGDIADIQAKFNAHNTVTGSLGLVAAAGLARYIHRCSMTTLWMLFAVLTYVHIYANVQCMRLLQFNVCNMQRLQLLFAAFWDHYYKDDDNNNSNESLVMHPSSSSTSITSRSNATTDTDIDTKDTDTAANTTPLIPTTTSSSSSSSFFPTPAIMARQEPLFFFSRFFVFQDRQRPIIQMGVSFNQFMRISQWTEDELQSALLLLYHGNDSDADRHHHHHHHHHAEIDSANYDTTTTTTAAASYVVALGDAYPSQQMVVVVALMSHATPLQHTQAYVHALLLQHLATVHANTTIKNKTTIIEPNRNHNHHHHHKRRIEHEAMRQFRSAWPLFYRLAAQSGWDLHQSELHTKGYGVTIQYRR